MTEVEIKELARKYINSCTKREGFVILTEGIMNDFIDLFVAGFMKCLELKAGSPKWHKVADGDLPKEDTIVLICYQGRGTIHYDIDYYCNKCFKWRDLRDIIAWREIPKYMEE